MNNDDFALKDELAKLYGYIVTNEHIRVQSLQYNDRISKKLLNELKLIPEDEMNTIINKAVELCIITHKKGYFSCIENKDQFCNSFVDNLLYVLSSEYNEGANKIFWQSLSFIFTPHLISDSFCGKEFVEGVLIYEGILFSILMGYESEQVRFMLNGLVGIQSPIAEVIGSQPKVLCHVDYCWEEWGKMEYAKSRLVDMLFTLKEEFYTYKSSIVSKELIYQKFMNEREKMDSRQCKEIIDKIHEVGEELGSKTLKVALSEYKSVTGSPFVQNLIYLFTHSTWNYDENVQIADYSFKYLMASKEPNIQYMESVLCYEGFMMLANREEASSVIPNLFKPIEIKFRLYGLIGEAMSFM